MHHAGRYAALGLAMAAALLAATPAAAQDGLRRLSQAEISVLLHDVRVEPVEAIAFLGVFYANGTNTFGDRVILRRPFSVFEGGICITERGCHAILTDAAGQIWFGPFGEPADGARPYRVRIIPIER